MKSQANLLAMLMVMLALEPNGSITANERLSIRVSPKVSFAPANMVVRTSIGPDAFNRAVEVVADSDSDQFYRSSLVQLDGDRAPRTGIFEFRSLPPGEYEVKAVLIGADGRARAIARTSVNVVESGASR
jgi:hypothetical protein